jgi:group I intron endonuclease
VIIYLAVNKVNGKMYIGQTIEKFWKRRYYHIWHSKRDSKISFHCALHKYGIETFDWVILEECGDLEALNFREQCYIAELGTLAPYGYNLDSGGRNKRVHQFTKEKLSRVHKGRIVPIDVKKKMSNSHAGLLGTIESRKRQSLAGIGERNSNTLLTWDIVNKIRSEYVGRYGEQRKLALKYNIPKSTIERIVHNKSWNYV